MAPIVDGVEEQLGDRVAVRRINAETGEGPEIMRRYRIPGHPVVLIFDSEGQEVRRLVGVQPADMIEEVLTSISSEPE